MKHLIAARRAKKRNKQTPNPDLMPLIDMVFILLIFFMLSSTFLKPVIKMELPGATTENEVDNKSPIVITIDADGIVYLNQTIIELSELKAELLKVLDGKPAADAAVIFSSDKKAAYELFLTVIDQLKQLDIHNISLEHE